MRFRVCYGDDQFVVPGPESWAIRDFVAARKLRVLERTQADAFGISDARLLSKEGAILSMIDTIADVVIVDEVVFLSKLDIFSFPPNQGLVDILELKRLLHDREKEEEKEEKRQRVLKRQGILGRVSPEFTVIVKTQTGKTIMIRPVRLQMLVEDLKEAVREREGIPQNQQRLIFAGRQLEDGRTLFECNISDLSELCTLCCD